MFDKFKTNKITKNIYKIFAKLQMIRGVISLVFLIVLVILFIIAHINWLPPIIPN